MGVPIHADPGADAQRIADGVEPGVGEEPDVPGRAGRLGFNEIGKAIILAETPLERAQLFQKYVLGTPEEVKSSFQNRDLPTWTLRLLSQVLMNEPQRIACRKGQLTTEQPIKSDT